MEEVEERNGPVAKGRMEASDWKGIRIIPHVYMFIRIAVVMAFKRINKDES